MEDGGFAKIKHLPKTSLHLLLAESVDLLDHVHVGGPLQSNIIGKVCAKTVLTYLDLVGLVGVGRLGAPCLELLHRIASGLRCSPLLIELSNDLVLYLRVLGGLLGGHLSLLGIFLCITLPQEL